MTTPPPDIAAIAASLGPSVREFVMSPFYTVHSHGIPFAWVHDARFWAGRELARLCLVERRRIEPNFFASIPNETGLAVRAYLLSKEQNDG